MGLARRAQIIRAATHFAGGRTIAVSAPAHASHIIDPSRLDALWQDSSATVAVTATGQTVGAAENLGTGGGIFNQLSAAQRPVYDSAGGRHWLDFDGVDDRLTFPSNAVLSTSSQFLIGVAVRATLVSTAVLLSRKDGDADISLLNGQMSFRPFEGGTRITSPAATVSDGVPFTFIAEHKGGVATIYKDGASVASGAVTGTTSYLDRVSTIFGANSANGLVYAVAIIPTATDADVADLHTWLNYQATGSA